MRTRTSADGPVITPLVLFPSDVFVHQPFVLTMEGQCIIKNLVLVSAAMVVGATVRGGRLKAEPTGEYRRTGEWGNATYRT